VSGAASGIGFAVSEALAARGCSVALADIDHERVQSAAAEIAERAPDDVRVEALAFNVADSRAFSDAAARASERIGDIELLVNNAGTVVGGEAQDLTPAHWDRVVDVNLKGAIHGIQAVYPGMVARGRGHVVNLASLAGLVPAPLMVPYGASKFGVVGLSLGLRAEAACHGVGVTVVCPGVVETPLLTRNTPDGLRAAASAPDMRGWVSRNMGGAYAPETLALDILKAVEQDQALLVAPLRARAAWLLMRLFPHLGLRIATRRVVRRRR
jgi:NADP-dependent 3-hydroxy acid dehydrogenase YdfG